MIRGGRGCLHAQHGIRGGLGEKDEALVTAAAYMGRGDAGQWGAGGGC